MKTLIEERYLRLFLTKTKNYYIFPEVQYRSQKKKENKIKYFKQVCIYAFTKNELNFFRGFKRKSKIEKIEDIEILRFFETNKKIKMVKVSNSAVAVDEPSDKKKVERILNEKK